MKRKATEKKEFESIYHANTIEETAEKLGISKGTVIKYARLFELSKKRRGPKNKVNLE